MGVANDTRSPLKARPLRNPGQSLEEQLRDTISDLVFGPVLFAVCVASIAAAECWRYYHPAPVAPVLYSVVAIGAVAYADYRVVRVLPQIRALKLGRDGEKAIGQFLESLREKGFRVFHDVVGDRFNVDHVLIGPAGIFTIETKTHSKPLRGRAKIEYDGERILLNGCAPDRDPVVQAKAQASWLCELLSNSTGRKFDIRPVIVYPGWFIERNGVAAGPVHVLNPRRLPEFLEREPARLSREDVHLASFHLSRFIRTS